MSTRDARVDAYIRKSAPFARPILEHLRAVVHAASAKIEETMKWGFPHFMYKGMLCGMAAFKQHATFGFWKGSLIVARGGKSVDEAMGQFGRLASLKDLPPKRALTAYVREAMRLNDEGVKVPARARPKTPRPILVPPDLAAALAGNAKARAMFGKFTPSHRREYCEWIASAKRDATRARRLAAAMAQIARGKPQNWKYL
ncbi:MAG TPA: YdeI/OmpD-associated family protein [Steroidobacteraceae bacterium]|nr:YdeI/OmpD-associated family protein [Steroidobacteraceae bacterium]